VSVLLCSAPSGVLHTKMRVADRGGVAVGEPQGDPAARARSGFFCFSFPQSREKKDCTSSRTDRGGLLNLNHSSVFSEIQEQTQLRALAICHLSPVLSLQAERRWGSAAAGSCKAVSGEAMQKDDYSLVFTIRELGSV